MRHGTFSGYDWHACRCFECRRFIADYRAHQRSGLIVTVYPAGSEPRDLRAFVQPFGGSNIARRINYTITPKGRAYLSGMEQGVEVA